MKFIREEISGQEKTRYMFAIGNQEAQVLVALLEKAIMYMPKLFITQTVEARMRNMLNEIRKSIPLLPKGQDDEDFKTYKNW